MGTTRTRNLFQGRTLLQRKKGRRKGRSTITKKGSSHIVGEKRITSFEEEHGGKKKSPPTSQTKNETNKNKDQRNLPPAGNPPTNSLHNWRTAVEKTPRPIKRTNVKSFLAQGNPATKKNGRFLAYLLGIQDKSRNGERRRTLIWLAGAKPRKLT